MTVDLWGWFHRYADAANQEGNPLKQRLVNLSHQGRLAIQSEDLDLAASLYEEGVNLARTLREPCWELFYQYYCAEVYIFHKSDYQTGLEWATKATAIAHKDAYLSCPVRGRVYYTLIYAYSAIDSLGYEDKIREMLAYMEQDVPMDIDTVQRIQYSRAQLAFDREAFDECERELNHYMNLIVTSSYRQGSAYNLARRLAFARGDLKLALDFVYRGYEWARRHHRPRSTAFQSLHEALYLTYLGEHDRAAAALQHGISYYERHDIPRLSNYYEQVCLYRELHGDTQTARKLREQQIAEMQSDYGFDYRFYTHLEYCRLLGRLGLELTQALQTTRTILQESVDPGKHAPRLARVEAGDYYEYEWQKPAP